MTADRDQPPLILWVLGAGFSAPLGGPLLKDLVGQSTLLRAARFPWSSPDRLWALNSVYQCGLEFTQWDDPETFIAYVLDSCLYKSKAAVLYAIANTAKNRFGKRQAKADDVEFELPRGDFEWIAGEDFVHECRRLALIQVSVATSEFTDDARTAQGSPDVNPVVSSELWLPYREWLKALGKRDARHCLASFNYDIAVELAGGASVQVPLPEEPPTEGIPLIKLHGSVNWYVEQGVPVRTPDLQPSMAIGREPFLGVPGREKYAKSLELDHLWERACTAAEEASAIVFMGYRFPPSDNYANSRLLRAIQKNRNEYLRVLLVLGPNDSPDSRRMERLCHLACSRKPNSKVRNTRLFAQDMMLLYERRLVLDDYEFPS